MVEAAAEIVALCRGQRVGRLTQLPGEVGLGATLELNSVLVRLHLLAVECEKASGPTLKRPDIADLTARALGYLPSWPARFERLIAALEESGRDRSAAPVRPLYNAIRNVRLSTTRTLLVDGSRAYLESTRRDLPIAFLQSDDVLLTRAEARALLSLHAGDALPRGARALDTYFARSGLHVHVYQDSRERFYSKNEVLSLGQSVVAGTGPMEQGQSTTKRAVAPVDLSGPVFRGNQYRAVRADSGHVSLTYEGLARRLGTSIGIARRIGQSGRFTRHEIEVHPISVAEWLDALSGKVQRPPRDASTVDFRSFRQRAFQLKLDETQFLTLIEGQAVVFQSAKGRAVLDESSFPSDEVDAALAPFEQPDEGWVGRNEVETTCALLPHEFDHLRRAGYFGRDYAEASLKRGRHIAVSALEHYRSNYVSRRALRLPSHRHTPNDIFRPGFDVERATAVRVYGKLRVFYRECLNAEQVKARTGVEI